LGKKIDFQTGLNSSKQGFEEPMIQKLNPVWVLVFIVSLYPITVAIKDTFHYTSLHFTLTH